MKITEPIIIRKVKPTVYEATGLVEGIGVLTRRGRSMEEAKDQFFDACNSGLSDNASHRRMPVKDRTGTSRRVMV
jgi:hypothetical protein